MPFEFIPTRIPEVLRVVPQVFGDERGFFMETWHKDAFCSAGIDVEFFQDCHSRSTRGTLRGLHYQYRHPQGKLVRVLTGAVFDVAVDVRTSSPTFGHWVGHVLCDETRNEMWIPVGFAHGFYVLSEVADVAYKCTDRYDPEHEVSLRWDAAEVGVEWPLIDGESPILSSRDAAGLAWCEIPPIEGHAG